MARYVANGTGNFNTAATWDTVANTPSLHASSNINITTAGVLTDTFTAPNTTNAATGCLIFAATYAASGRDWTAELEESGVATGSIATILQTDMPATAGWVYFRLATPYTYTTTAAGAYAWRIKSTTANSGSAAGNASLTAIAVLSTDDRHTAPASTSDNIYIVPPNCTTALTVTVDGTSGTVGASDTLAAVARSLNTGITLGGALSDSKAILKWDTSASATLKNQGTYIITDGGEHQMGTVASPYPAAYTAIHDQYASTGSVRGVLVAGTGRFIMQGQPLAYYSTTYVSGTGVAASPLVVSDPVDWTVGDRILVTATSANGTNYNENEYRYIITKNSSTSYVLSSSSGGAQTAFTYTHNTNAKVLNLTRNVRWQAGGIYKISMLISTTTTLDDVDIDWALLQHVGSTGGTLTTTSPGSFYESTSSNYISCDYTVFDLWNGYGLVNKRNDATYTNNIFIGGITSTIAATGGGFATTGANCTLTNCYFIGNAGNYGLEYAGINGTFTGLYFNGCNTSGTSNKGGMYVTGGAPLFLNSCEFHCNRVAGLVAASTTNSAFTSCAFGTKGVNQTADIYILSNTANNIVLNSSSMGSTDTVQNYLNGATGATLIAFDTLNGTTNNHKWYTEYGTAQSTGSGLSDTTIRTSNTLNVRLSPENSSVGFKYEYKVLAVPGQAVSTFGFIRKNAAFGTDVALVELFLPGSTSADASQTMGNTTGSYLVYNLAATYSGSVSRYATVRISARSTTSAAYIYVADISNGTNHVIDLTTWDKGQPSSIMFEQLGDAAAVWAVLTSTLTTSGTTGNLLTKLLTVAKFLGLK